MKELALCIILLPDLLSIPQPSQWITWNVGQGEFNTILNANQCIHFDSGGENFPFEVVSLCSRKKNIILFSHEDKDHINFIRKLTRYFADICTLHATQNKDILNLETCTSLPKKVQLLFQTQQFKDKNSNSNIYLYDKKILFPGDSTKKSEKLWAHHLQKLKSIQYWTVAHHGSQSSTSEYFLKQLRQPLLKQHRHSQPRAHFIFATVSARQRKYGHPHPKILQRLKSKKIPVLRTQDWGHIRVIL